MMNLEEQIQKEKNQIANNVLLLVGVFIIFPAIASVSRVSEIGWHPILYIQIFVLVSVWALYLC